jgi:hypothetical protein
VRVASKKRLRTPALTNLPSFRPVRKKPAKRRNVARKRNAHNARRPKDSTRKWKGSGNGEIDEQPGANFTNIL